MLNTLTTSDVPPSDRQAFWRQVIADRFMALDFESKDAVPFAANLDVLQLANLDLMRLEASAHAVARSSKLVQKDASDFFMLSYQRRGEGMLEQDEKVSIQTAGDFVLYDSRRPFAMSYSGDFCKYVIRIPRAKLQAHISQPQRLCGMTVSKDSEAGLVLGAMLSALFSGRASSNVSVQESLARAFIEVTIGGLQSIPEAPGAECSKLQTFHLHRVKRYILDNLQDPNLNVERISADLKLSMSSLYRIFESERLTLSQWIWHRRLENCKRDLLCKHLAHKHIGDIAFDWGYSSCAHFSRVFKKETGMTPKEFRLKAAHSC